MQPLPTEAGPRSVCAHCGDPLPPPNGSATFVYGVGAVGYQSCASCGAKWRYLWQEVPEVRVKPDRGRRLVVVVGAVALALLLVVGGVAVAQSKPWNRGDAPAEPTTSSAPVSTTTSSAPPVDLRIPRLAYLGIAEPMDASRTAFMGWLVDSATATPQLQVSERTEEYVQEARVEIRRFEVEDWPAVVAGDIDSLVDTARQFVDDLEPILTGQAGSPSYVRKITDEAEAVRTADNAARQALGLDPVPE